MNGSALFELVVRPRRSVPERRDKSAHKIMKLVDRFAPTNGYHPLEQIYPPATTDLSRAPGAVVCDPGLPPPPRVETSAEGKTVRSFTITPQWNSVRAKLGSKAAESDDVGSFADPLVASPDVSLGHESSGLADTWLPVAFPAAILSIRGEFPRMTPIRKKLKCLARNVGLRRAHIVAARMYVERHSLATVMQAGRRNRGRILCYHSVGLPLTGVNNVTPDQFRRHIELALEAGFRFVPATEIARGGGRADELAITFDDGWKSIRTQAAPILKDYGIACSIFVISDWAEQLSSFAQEYALCWHELHDLAAAGVKIGSHSATHPDFGKLEVSRMRDELEASQQMFERRLGFRPDELAIPYGQSANWPQAAREAAKDVGYDIVYAQAEDTRPPGTVARTFVTKFDHDRTFTALLSGAYDRWEEWY
jgi:peptidoglycan/xylan/chitin deacetylase (PgdA/CDA1 family)